MVTGTLESALEQLLEGIMSDAGTFIGLGQALGGLGSLSYVFFRIWGHMARNEETDLYPLMRPLAISLLLIFYTNICSGVIAMNRLLNDGTKSLVTSKEAQITMLMNQKTTLQKNLAAQQLRDNLPQDSDGDGSIGWWEKMDSWVSTMSSSVLVGGAMSNILSDMLDFILTRIGELVYFLASMVIKFLQTFFLAVLLITGPITIGLSAFDWFYPSLSSWVGRLIHFMLWIPLANLLGGMVESIHIVMLRADIAQLRGSTSEGSFVGDLGMIIFYFLATAAYVAIPKAATYILESSGAGQAIGAIGTGLKTQGALGGGLAGTVSGGGGAVSGAAGGVVGTFAGVGKAMTSKV